MGEFGWTDENGNIVPYLAPPPCEAYDMIHLKEMWGKTGFVGEVQEYRWMDPFFKMKLRRFTYKDRHIHKPLLIYRDKEMREETWTGYNPTSTRDHGGSSSRRRRTEEIAGWVSEDTVEHGVCALPAGVAFRQAWSERFQRELLGRRLVSVE